MGNQFRCNIVDISEVLPILEYDNYLVLKKVKHISYMHLNFKSIGKLFDIRMINQDRSSKEEV